MKCLFFVLVILAGLSTAIELDKIIKEMEPYEEEAPLENIKISLTDWYQNRRKKEELPKEIVVTTWEDRPYSWVERLENNTLRGRGLAFEIFDMIMKHLEMNYTIKLPKYQIVGDRDRKGMMNQLATKEVDMAVGFLPIVAELREFCSYGVILDTMDITVLLKRPIQSAVGSGLLAPFDTFVWICILISLIVVGPIFFVITSYRGWLFKTKEDTYSCTNCVWFTYGAILKQGSAMTPENDSIRLLFATWWLYITIVTSFYTANLTAFLTLSEFTLDITSLETVVEKRQPWVAETEHIINVNLDAGEEELDKLKNSYMEGYGQFDGIVDKYPDILKHVNNDKLYIGNKPLNDRIVHSDYLNRTNVNIKENKRCVYVMMPEPIFQQNRAFAYQKDSIIQEVIDRKLNGMVEMGIITHLETYTMPLVRYCPLNLRSTERQLTNTDLSLTYQVIGSGFMFSVLVFFLELLQRCMHCENCLCCSKACGCCSKRVVSISPPPEPERPKAPSPPKPSFTISNTPPIYESIYNRPNFAKTHIINGRDYWIITESDGERRLVPIRSPSALLFQYTS